MLGASQAALFGAASAAVTYDSLVAIFDPDVVSYWKFENDGVDENGRQDASLVGGPEQGVDTIVHLDRIADGASADGQCIAWPGSGGVYAQAEHNGAHKTAQGSIVVTFQHDSLGQKSILVAADANAASGGLSLEVETDGSPRCFLRRQSDGVPVPLAGQPGDVALNQAHTMIFKWGPAGLSMALWNEDGTLVRRVTDLLADGVTGTSPIRFGLWHDGVQSPHHGPYGRVIWLKRRISDGEEAILAKARTIIRGTLGTVLVGAWPLSETSGTIFTDTIGTNDATLAVPTWTLATHEHNRPGIVAGSDAALEVSNGGPAIPMTAGYKKSAMSLALYVAPLSELRGLQYWSTTNARHGREFIAYCDDGSTPGSFAIERRRFSSTEWRLDGYVRNSAGTAVRFSGGLSGISGATLPVDVAKRIVLTQGPTGAALFLDGSQVAHLPFVTEGWSSLTTPITLGSSSDPGHANERSPLWGRLDQIEVWQGQMTLSKVQALAAAVQSKLWRWPSDFNPATSINRANHSSWQSAMNAADTAGTYVYQDVLGEFGPADPTWYPAIRGNDGAGNGNALSFRNNCKGMLGCRMRKPDGESQKFARMVNIGNQSSGKLTSPAASGYKIIGCEFDGNARNQDWHPKNGQAGFAFTGFNLEQAHAIFTGHSSTPIILTVDACKFYDGTGDALSLNQRTNITVKSIRFYGYFRGPTVVNASPVDITAMRYESFNRTEFGSVINGFGFQDIESFGGEGAACHMKWLDVWAESDFDDESEGTAGDDGFTRYYNCHINTAVIHLIPAGDGIDFPTQRWEAFYCTFGYHRHGGNGSGNSPSSWWKGFPGGANGLGCLFDNCVFIANGDPYYVHAQWLTNPTATPWEIFYDSAGGSVQGPRIYTMRDCEWRVRNLGSVATSNITCIRHEPMSTSITVELDGVRIDAAFADLPFAMGGVTVRHRNVLHERTGSTKPWSGAGAEVPI